MDPMMAGTAVGLALYDDPQRIARCHMRSRPRRARFALAVMTAVIVIVTAAAVVILGGCAAPQGGHAGPRPSTFITPVYKSPVGGSNVYRVDGPEGTQIITVSPGYQSPIGGSNVHHIQSSGVK